MAVGEEPLPFPVPFPAWPQPVSVQVENLILGDEGATWGALEAGVGPFCFLLISKHNIDSGAKGQRHILLEDLRLGGW